MTHEDAEKLARRRAGARMGWYIHAIVFMLVNLLLAMLAYATDRNWAISPAAGWGLGLAIHGFVVFMVVGGGGLHERLVARERERLALQRDSW